ncbi:MAG: glycosyltransferase, partial [bacterium]|nr:glycosyltransferase [bacterium]
AYSYLKCKKLGFDFLYIREAVILYRSPNNLKDHMLQSIRFFKGQKEFEKDHLNKMSVEEHKIPTRIILTSTIKYFFKNPFFCLSYAIILIVARVKSQRGERAQARWIMSSSSKTLIIADTTLKICFFGTYDGNYSRNQILLKGLKMNGACVDEVHLGLNKENIDKDEHLSIFAMLKRIFRKLKFIPIILKNWNKIRSCDIIFVAHPPHLDIPFAYILAKIFRKPLVSDIQYALSTMFVDEFGLLPVYSIKSKALKLIDKLIFSLSDFNLFDTDLSRNFYQKMFRIPMEKTNVLPIGADNDIYQYSGINTNRNKLTVIYYGLYNPMHGVEHIVECARLLKEKDDIEFLMIGNGQTYLENKNRADEFGLKNMVFLSEVMEKDAKEYLDKGDIFLGFMNKSVGAENSVPNKVFQGLSMGKAVVTAETPIMIKVFKQKENIYLVKLGDANSLCAAILDLKNNLDLLNKIAKNGHEIYMTKFTPEAIGKSLIKIFNDILFNKSDKVKFNYNQPK